VTGVAATGGVSRLRGRAAVDFGARVCYNEIMRMPAAGRQKAGQNEDVMACLRVHACVFPCPAATSEALGYLFFDAEYHFIHLS
jgi:hypothetical protein